MKEKTPNFAQKKSGVPLLEFSPLVQRGSQTILTISEYGCCTNIESERGE